MFGPNKFYFSYRAIEYHSNSLVALKLKLIIVAI